MEASYNGRRALRMKDWLFNLLEQGHTRGLCWEDRSQLIFRIEWKHGSRHGYSVDKDAVVFKEWAEYTGKLKPNQPDPKRWKANFRCALNSLKNVQRVTSKKNKRADAFRRYQFVDCFRDIRAIKQEPGNEYPMLAFDPLSLEPVKIKKECQEYKITPPTLNNLHYHYPLTPRPEAELLQGSTAEQVEPQGQMSPIYPESNVPPSPPLTPSDGRCWLDLDIINALSDADINRLSEWGNLDLTAFDEITTQC